MNQCWKKIPRLVLTLWLLVLLASSPAFNFISNSSHFLSELIEFVILHFLLCSYNPTDKAVLKKQNQILKEGVCL